MVHITSENWVGCLSHGDGMQKYVIALCLVNILKYNTLNNIQREVLQARSNNYRQYQSLRICWRECSFWNSTIPVGKHSFLVSLS